MIQESIQKFNSNGVRLYNPLSEDFVTTYDINENRSPVSFIIPAGEIKYFEPPLAEHMQNHLALAVAATKADKNTTKNYQEALEEIVVNI